LILVSSGAVEADADYPTGWRSTGEENGAQRRPRSGAEIVMDFKGINGLKK
jgi:hypothetical protein